MNAANLAARALSQTQPLGSQCAPGQAQRPARRAQQAHLDSARTAALVVISLLLRELDRYQIIVHDLHSIFLYRHCVSFRGLCYAASIAERLEYPPDGVEPKAMDE